MKQKSLDELIKAYFELKPLSRDDAITVEREVARRELERWLDMFAHGCSDPCWPDGVNLNLTRNQILAAVHRLKEMGNDVSAVFIPPLVDDGLMVSAGKRFKARLDRFKQTGKHVQIAGTEISLF